jgi:hypothetical protein
MEGYGWTEGAVSPHAMVFAIITLMTEALQFRIIYRQIWCRLMLMSSITTRPQVSIHQSRHAWMHDSMPVMFKCKCYASLLPCCMMTGGQAEKLLTPLHLTICPQPVPTYTSSMTTLPMGTTPSRTTIGSSMPGSGLSTLIPRKGKIQRRKINHGAGGHLTIHPIVMHDGVTYDR